ncbi:MAG TPA: hypothetical protein VFJ19_15115 [Nocardioidaceae bacterium]|nr:hypothetical protein [Nocardioidaceae bacterium]
MSSEPTAGSEDGDGERPSSRGSAGRDAAAILGSFVVLGVVGAFVWWLLVDPAVFTETKSGGAMGEAQLAKRFATDGWYAVIGVIGGLIAGAGLAWWRARDPLFTSAMLVVGAVVAAAIMAWVGYLLGPGDTTAALAHAPVGAHVPVSLSVNAGPSFLSWPIGTLVGALVMLWTPATDRRSSVR